MSYLEWLMLAPTIIGVFAVIAKYTPNKTVDRIVQMLFDIVNVMAQNSGKAANK